MTKWIVAAAPFLLGVMSASAGIVPSWRVNPISSALQNRIPDLNGALSISLMVELDAASLFYDAGLDLSAALPSALYYNHAAFGSDIRPRLGLSGSLIFPELYFDTYVASTTDDQWPVLQGRLNGTGAAQVGVNGADGGEFNAAWNAAPGTGGPGRWEVARITFLASSNLAFDPLGTPISPGDGYVRDNLNPTQSISLPPIPVVVIPEPVAAITFAAICLCLRRRSA